MTGAPRERAAAAAKLLELLFYPSACKLCGATLGRRGEMIVCRACLDGLAPWSGASCPRCGRFHAGEGEEYLCGRCLERVPPYALHRSCGAYGGVLKETILLFKYRKYAPLSRPLAEFAASCLGAAAGLWDRADFILAVPLHPSRRRERGFNQSRLLARDLSRLCGIELLDGCLVRVKSAPPQAALRAADRAENIRGAYAVRRGRRIVGKTLVLVDDVFTTGATVGECGRVLLQAGAAEVRAVTLAQA